MVEACSAVPFAYPVLTADCALGGRGWREGGECGCEGLDAAVEGRGVETLDGRREGEEMDG